MVKNIINDIDFKKCTFYHYKIKVIMSLTKFWKTFEYVFS